MRFSKELSTAIEAAQTAGQVVLSYARKDVLVSDKPNNDISSEADKASHLALARMISVRFSKDAILSEDAKDDTSRLKKKRVWIIDPLDGTRNFVDYARIGDQNCRFFGVHVGLVADGSPILGVVYCPTTDELFFAEKDYGAFIRKDGQENRLCVTGRQFADMKFSLAPSVYKNERLADFVRSVEGSSSNVGYVFGYPVVGIAKGDHDAYVAFPSDPKKIGEWDICAPGLILEEAGGKITDLKGNPFKFNQVVPYVSTGVCASNNMMHDYLIETLHSTSPLETQFLRSRKSLIP